MNIKDISVDVKDVKVRQIAVYKALHTHKNFVNVIKSKFVELMN